jgi:hypothetical protein
MTEFLERLMLSACVNADIELSWRDQVRLVRDGMSYGAKLAIWQYDLAQEVYPELRQPCGGQPGGAA